MSMRACGPLLELGEIRERLGLARESHGGLHAIPVDHIVGTVDRCCDFDRCFHAQRPDLQARVSAVQRAFPEGAFPPIDVVQVDDAYFVVDGHKRVAAARRLGVATIDANVARVPSPVPLDGTIGRADLPRLEAEERFLVETGLRGVRVPCRSPAAYAELAEVIKAHGYDMMRAEGRLLPAAEMAAHWYAHDLVPTLRDAGDIAGLLACCPAGDLYLALHRRSDAEELRTPRRWPPGWRRRG
jgi:ParB-like nuclease family protein